MFGSSNTSSTPFGSTTGGFGSSTTAGGFGSSPFGQPQQQQPTTTGFGAPAFGQTTGAFGAAPQQQQPLGGGFGTSTTTSTPFGGGGFGQQQQAQPFGTSTFGAPAPAPTGLFGTSTSTGTGFGASASATTGGGFGSTFGAPAPSGGLFGSSTTTNTGGGLFGAPAPSAFGGGTGAFGQASQPTTTGFGAPAFGAAPATSTFGAPAPVGNVFGSSLSTPSTTAFGSPAPLGGGLFGSPAPAPLGGGTNLFGAPAPAMGAMGQAGGGPGTRGAAFQTTRRPDGTSSIELQSITAMPQYENYSFEELRFQDHEQGVRGPTAGTPTASNTTQGGFGFGSPAPAPAFGTTSTTGGFFGAPAPAPSTGLFGSPSPAPAPFGAPAPSTGLFGSTPAPAPFGAPAPSTGLFGSSPAPAAFGAPAPSTGLFGAPAPSTGLFGSTPAPAPTTAFGGFGSTTPAPAPFGAAPAPSTGLFGSTPAPAPSTAFGGFGQTPAPAPGGFFGSTPAPAPGTGLFGSTPAPAFGTGAFGQTSAPAPAFGSAFGQAPAPATSGLFGQPSTTAFGAPQTAAPPPAAIPVNANVIPPVANEILEQQLRALQNERKELDKSAVWQGKDLKSSPTTALNLSSDGAGLFSPTRFSLSPFKTTTPGSGVKIRPRGFPKTEPAKSTNGSVGLVFGRDNGSIYTPESHLRSAATTLVLRSEKLKNRPLRLTFDSKVEAPPMREDIESVPRDQEEASATVQPANVPSPLAPTNIETPTIARTKAIQRVAASEIQSPADYYQHLLSTDEEEMEAATPLAAVQRQVSEFVPTLTKEGYSMTPSSEVLARMSDVDLATVANFSVAREGLGKVEWIGQVDVRDAHLDDIVIIEQGDISVYAKAEAEGTKPELGSKLNRPAMLTFYDMFPPDTSANGKSEKEKVAAFERKLVKSARKAGAEFISYDASVGEWKIKVQHFSRYAVCDDTDSDTEPDSESPLPIETPQILRKAKSIVNRQGTPGKTSRIVAPKESMDESDEESTSGGVVYSDDAIMELVEKSAKEAFSDLNSSVLKLPSPTSVTKEVSFDNDCMPTDEFQIITIASVQPPDEQLLREAQAGPSIFAKLKKQIAPTLLVRRPVGPCMRVGWHPDGSLLLPAQLRGKAGCVLVKSRPVLAGKNAFLDTLKPLKAIRDCSGAHPGWNGGMACLALPTQTNSHSLLQSVVKVLAESASDDEVRATFQFTQKMLKVRETSGHGREEVELHTPVDARLLSALSDSLTGLCMNERDAAQRRCLSKSQLIHAFSAGAMEEAIKVAAEQDCWDLLDCISTSTAQQYTKLQIVSLSAGNLIQKADSNVLRLLRSVGAASGGSIMMKSGPQTDDWRLWLVRLIADNPALSMSELLEVYERALSTGEVPFPSASYVRERTEKSKRSIFYQLMQAVAHPSIFPSRDAVKPTCWTECEVDFSVSFYLSVILKALQIGSPLPAIQFESIVDSFKSQLLLEGLWPWAVLVELCFVSDLPASMVNMKIARAKDIVVRNYRSTQDELLLNDTVVISEEWKTEALAGRAAYEGNIAELVTKLVTLDVEKALALFEREFLPEVYDADGISRSNMAKIKRIAEDGGPNTVANALYLLETVRREVMRLTPDCNMTIFKAPMNQIRQILTSYTSIKEKDRSTYAFLKRTSETERCTLSSTIKQALVQLEFLERHLKAVELFGLN